MNDRALLCTGAVGAVIAAICCVTPILAVLLPLVGLGAWLASIGVFAARRQPGTRSVGPLPPPRRCGPRREQEP